MRRTCTTLLTLAALAHLAFGGHSFAPPLPKGVGATTRRTVLVVLASEPLQPDAETSQNEEEEKGQFVTRFSAFAPDPNLPTEDFRAQLKENMKADLERRRRENPSRGHQPAKTYLDSLSNNE